MNEETAQALEESIAHWGRMLSAETVKELDGEGPHADQCALCALFYNDECFDCPVLNKTNRDLCRDTPYAQALDAFIAWENASSAGWIARTSFRAAEKVAPAREAWRRAAALEIDFLRSLREPKS